MSNTEIKIHNVLHDPEQFSTVQLEQRMKNVCIDDRVTNIRIAKGNANSPVYITLKEGSAISIQDAKSIARQILKEFDRNVSGIDIDNTIKDRNIQIRN